MEPLPVRGIMESLVSMGNALYLLHLLYPILYEMSSEIVQTSK